jgi:hypothetical protein
MEAFLHRQVQTGIDPTGQAGRRAGGQGRHDRANERTRGQTGQKGISDCNGHDQV